VRTNSTGCAALIVAKGAADAMICGTFGDTHCTCAQYISDILYWRPAC